MFELLAGGLAKDDFEFVANKLDDQTIQIIELRSGGISEIYQEGWEVGDILLLSQDGRSILVQDKKSLAVFAFDVISGDVLFASDPAPFIGDLLGFDEEKKCVTITKDSDGSPQIFTWEVGGNSWGLIELPQPTFTKPDRNGVQNIYLIPHPFRMEVLCVFVTASHASVNISTKWGEVDLRYRPKYGLEIILLNLESGLETPFYQNTHYSSSVNYESGYRDHSAICLRGRSFNQALFGVYARARGSGYSGTPSYDRHYSLLIEARAEGFVRSEVSLPTSSGSISTSSAGLLLHTASSPYADVGAYSIVLAKGLSRKKGGFPIKDIAPNSIATYQMNAEGGAVSELPKNFEKLSEIQNLVYPKQGVHFPLLEWPYELNGTLILPDLNQEFTLSTSWVAPIMYREVF